VGRVISITDGDTITLVADWKKYTIRLGEIDAPELDQPWGKKATDALSERILWESVRIQVTDVDRYGRLIGRIWLEDRDINRELLAEGHAWLYRQYMTDRSLRKDERYARKNGLGLWQRIIQFRRGISATAPGPGAEVEYADVSLWQ
jgi:endonuclease YncB( thermonuclease family)|tara:strand:- start:99 stop:539 length:441 start_codon:yes stop_codon:yes gene_type:complete